VFQSQNRRWLQFSLRGVLALTFFACCAFGWLAWRIDQVKRQKTVVAELETLGWNCIGTSGSGIPEWAKTLLGEDPLFAVVSVARWRDHAFRRAPISPRFFVLLSQLPKLQELDLSHTRISDCDVPQLNVLHNLRRLSLVRTDITPDGLRDLELALPDCQISR